MNFCFDTVGTTLNLLKFPIFKASDALIRIRQQRIQKDKENEAEMLELTRKQQKINTSLIGNVIIL